MEESMRPAMSLASPPLPLAGEGWGEGILSPREREEELT